MWDFRKESLMATVNMKIPTLLRDTLVHKEPIPNQPPKGFRKDNSPMLMHGENWDGVRK